MKPLREYCLLTKTAVSLGKWADVIHVLGIDRNVHFSFCFVFVFFCFIFVLFDSFGGFGGFVLFCFVLLNHSSSFSACLLGFLCRPFVMFALLTG